MCLSFSVFLFLFTNTRSMLMRRSTLLSTIETINDVISKSLYVRGQYDIKLFRKKLRPFHNENSTDIYFMDHPNDEYQYASR